MFSKHIETDELVHELTKNDFNLFKLSYKENLKSFQIKMRIKIKFASIVEASHRLRHEILYRKLLYRKITSIKLFGYFFRCWILIRYRFAINIIHWD